MSLKSLRSESEYETMLERATQIVALDPRPGTPRAVELESIVFLLMEYEAQHFKLAQVDEWEPEQPPPQMVVDAEEEAKDEDRVQVDQDRK